MRKVSEEGAGLFLNKAFDIVGQDIGNTAFAFAARAVSVDLRVVVFALAEETNPTVKTDTRCVTGTAHVPFADDAGSAFAQNARNLPAERGVSTFHTPHRLVLAPVYTLPFDKAVGNSRFLMPVLSGWQTTGIPPPWPADPSPSPPAATKATPTAVPIVPTRSLIGASRNPPR